jgi:hypothetical protein
MLYWSPETGTHGSEAQELSASLQGLRSHSCGEGRSDSQSVGDARELGDPSRKRRPSGREVTMGRSALGDSSVADMSRPPRAPLGADGNRRYPLSRYMRQRVECISAVNPTALAAIWAYSGFNSIPMN